MTLKAKTNVEYTIATHAAEKISLSREAIALCERIADGHIFGDAAVAEILRRYGVESRRANVWRIQPYDVYAVAGSLYCYKDSNVLRNHFGLRDSEQLRMIESEISAARQSEMLEHPIPGRFTTTHLCNIHRKLFGDVYPFAGHLRYEDIAKGETRFLANHQIKEKLQHLLDELRNEQFLDGSDKNSLIQRSAYYMAELNYIHPFREGNGRAIREFMRLLFLRQGYSVDWSAVPVDHLLQVMVDSVYDTEPLTQVLSQCLK